MGRGEESSENLVGELIRRQRELAELSMRQVAAMAGISNPYRAWATRPIGSRARNDCHYSRRLSGNVASADR